MAASLRVATFYGLTGNLTLGADYFQRQNLDAHKRAYVKKLEKLGYIVTLSPLAA